MHQHPRPAPRSASAASNPSTNPERTNNPREGGLHQRTRSSVDLASYTERAGGQGGGEQPSRSDGSAAGPSQDREMTKLNQIIQHFFTKAALTICDARANLPQVHNRNGDIKQDRWFNIVLDETDVLSDSLQEWKRPDLSDNRPPPLVIESYIDTVNLSPNQALVAVDETGKRWDVSEALSASSAGSSPRPSNRNGGKSCEVVLERWTVELGHREDSSPAELNDALPNVYKKGVVLFRSLYTFLRFLPAWKLYRRLGRQQSGGNGGLRLKFRIRQGKHGSTAEESQDALLMPLFPSEQITKRSNLAAYSDEDIYRGGSEATTPSSRPTATAQLGALHTPGGALRVRVDYRPHCDFQAADAEALISSRFLHHDEGIPTLQGVGSLPTARSSHRREQAQAQQREPRALLGAYGSLGTFHATGKRESPLSALQHRTLSSQEEEDQYNMDRRLKLAGTGKPEIQRGGTTSDGKSVFKAGSLGSSPRSNQLPIPTSPIGISPPKYDRDGNPRDPNKVVSPGTFVDQIKIQKDEIRAIGMPDKSKRQSLNTLPQQALRVPPASLPNETAIASSGSSSPMAPPPMPRYQSSFGNRPKRASSTSQPGQAADSGGSSARASGSDQAGSGEVSDEGDIAGFVGLLESEGVKKMISSKPATGHTVNLSKYSNLRDPSGQLADEMSASSLINTSSTPPSRRLSNVPGLSTSSSPSRQMAHVPAVRSRLSTQSITEEAGLPNEESRDDEEEDEPFIFHTEGI